MLAKIYNTLIKKEGMVKDGQQIALLMLLEKYTSSKSTLYNIFSKKESSYGVYIYGSVGRGKTKMMDIFYANAKISNKHRVHFTHLIQRFNELITEGKKLKYNDPIEYIFKKYNHIKLLCIDEFEVLDVVTSIIIRRFLLHLLQKGCKIIVTSNTEPNNLYPNGLQRDKFLELINIFNTKFEVFSLNGTQDYRKLHLQDANYIHHHKIFEVKNGEESQSFIHLVLLKEILKKEVAQDNLEIKTLEVLGRKISLPTFEKLAIVDFTEFCMKNYGMNDYRVICQNFEQLIITNVLPPDINYLDAIRRFIWLIDEVYEAKITSYFTMFFDYKTIDLDLIARHVPQLKRAFSRLSEIDK